MEAEPSDRSKLRPHHALFIVLHDGSVVRVQPFRHVELRTPFKGVYGEGMHFIRDQGNSREFRGLIGVDSIASTRRIPDPHGSGTVLAVDLTDRSTIHLRSDSWVMIDAQQGIGLWCVGRWVPTISTPAAVTDSVFRGRLTGADIQRLRYREEAFDAPKTVIMVGGAATIIALIGLLAFLASLGS